MAQDRSPGRDVFTFAQDGAGATTTATSSRRASISSAKSATSTSSESDTTSLTSSYTDVSIEQKFEHPLSPTLVQLQKIRCTGLDYISTLHQLAAKKVLSACSISVYSLDGGSQCCATICVHGSETGIVYNTAFGCQLKATKQKAAKGLVEKLEWFLAPVAYDLPTACFSESAIVRCLREGVAPPLSEYALSSNQTQRLEAAEANLQLVNESTAPERRISYIAVDIEAYDNPSSPDFGCVKEIGVCCLPAGAVSTLDVITRHMIVAEREHLHNIFCTDATGDFAFGQSEVLPLAAVTREVEAIFEEASQLETSVYLVGWSFANDQKWLTDKKQFNVALNKWQVQIVDISMVWQAMHQSLEGRSLGDVLRKERIGCGTMHNAGNDARGTMELFWKIRGSLQ